MAQRETIQNGNWSDPNTWVGGLIPTTDDEVFIRHQIIYDLGDNPIWYYRINCYRYRTGTQADARLLVPGNAHSVIRVKAYLYFPYGGFWLGEPGNELRDPYTFTVYAGSTIQLNVTEPGYAYHLPSHHTAGDPDFYGGIEKAPLAQDFYYEEVPGGNVLYVEGDVTGAWKPGQNIAINLNREYKNDVYEGVLVNDRSDNTFIFYITSIGPFDGTNTHIEVGNNYISSNPDYTFKAINQYGIQSYVYNISRNISFCCPEYVQSYWSYIEDQLQYVSRGSGSGAQVAGYGNDITNDINYLKHIYFHRCYPSGSYTYENNPGIYNDPIDGIVMHNTFMGEYWATNNDEYAPKRQIRNSIFLGGQGITWGDYRSWGWYDHMVDLRDCSFVGVRNVSPAASANQIENYGGDAEYIQNKQHSFSGSYTAFIDCGSLENVNLTNANHIINNTLEIRNSVTGSLDLPVHNVLYGIPDGFYREYTANVKGARFVTDPFNPFGFSYSTRGQQYEVVANIEGTIIDVEDPTIPQLSGPYQPGIGIIDLSINGQQVRQRLVESGTLTDITNTDSEWPAIEPVSGSEKLLLVEPNDDQIYDYSYVNLQAFGRWGSEILLEDTGVYTARFHVMPIGWNRFHPRHVYSWVNALDRTDPNDKFKKMYFGHAGWPEWDVSANGQWLPIDVEFEQKQPGFITVQVRFIGWEEGAYFILDPIPEIF